MFSLGVRILLPWSLPWDSTATRLPALQLSPNLLYYATFSKSLYLLWASVPSLENKLAVNVSWEFFLSLGLGDIENCHMDTVRRYSEGEG